MVENLLKKAKETRSFLQNKLVNKLWDNVNKEEITNVVLILSSSRSGSSLLYELLKQTDQILTLEGEHSTFFKLHGLCFPFDQIKSDKINSSSYTNAKLFDISKEVIAELRVGAENEKFVFHEYALELALRLALQWPNLNISGTELLSLIYKSYNTYRHLYSHWNVYYYFLELIKELNKNGFCIDPNYYDIPKNIIEEIFPINTIMTSGPPNNIFCIEEPPFLVPKPRQYPTSVEVCVKPLLLKASVDAYRFDLIKSLFPKANIKIIHLTRNPVSCINSLIEGWQHNYGFFSQNVGSKVNLSIQNYTELHSWGCYWWKFDMPPNWETQINLPLEYICGFQWYSAHNCILQEIANENSNNVLKIKYEDLVGTNEIRYITMSRILDYVGVEFNQSLQKITREMPLVMTTSKPYPQKWKIRENTITPVIQQKELLYMSKFLNYSV